MIDIKNINGLNIGIVQSDDIILKTVQDALDLMVDVQYQGCDGLGIHSKNITPIFFDLKSKLLGDISQKFINYKMKLFIFGDFENLQSKSLRDFIYETNKGGNIMFLNNSNE